MDVNESLLLASDRLREITREDGHLDWNKLDEVDTKFWNHVGQMGVQLKLDADTFIRWCLTPNRKCGWTQPILYFSNPFIFCKLTARLMREQGVEIPTKEEQDEETIERTVGGASKAPTKVRD